MQPPKPGAATFRYAEVALFDFDAQLIDRRFVANENGRLQIALPPTSERQNITLVVRAYYGDELRFSESEVGLRLFPELDVPTSVPTGITAERLAGSTLELSLDDGVGPGLGDGVTGLIEVRDASGRLLASDDEAVRLVVPGDTSRLDVRTLLDDGLGNEFERLNVISVVDQLALTVSADQRPFDVGVADLNDAYLARGRRLLDRDGNLLVTLESEISAITHLGNRLLVALANIGLVILDPADDFRVLGTYAISGQVSALAVAGSGAVAIVDAAPQALSVAGNALTPVSLSTVSGAALEVLSDGSSFLLLTDEQFVVLDEQFQVVDRFAGSFYAMAVHDGEIYIATEGGGVLHVAADLERVESLRGSRTDGVNAQRLVSLQGYLLELTAGARTGVAGLPPRAAKVRVLDVRTPNHIALLGEYEFAQLGTDVSQAFVANGRLLAGASGAVVDVLRGVNGSTLFVSERPRGDTRHVAVDQGQFLAGAGFFGAQSLLRQAKTGLWEQSIIGRYVVSATDVAVVNGTRYVLQPDASQVVELSEETGAASAVLSGVGFEHLAVGDKLVAASAASALHVAERVVDSSGTRITDMLEVSVGDAIVGLVAFGEQFYVSTSGGGIYRVTPGELPLVDALVEVEAIVNLPEAVRIIAVNGDYLFFALGSDVHRMSLTEGVDQVLPMGATVTAFALSEGQLWVGMPGEAVLVNALDFALTSRRIATSGAVTALAAEHDRLSIGQGQAAVRIEQTPLAAVSADPSLSLPLANTVYHQGDVISMRLGSQAGVNVARYYINDEPVGTRGRAPFSLDITVPANLRNGQTFDISAEIETVWGDIIRSEPRRVLLQGEGLPANPFSVELNLLDVYLPKPLQSRAQIVNSTEPVAQVEFYYAPVAGGAFELIGKHFGPEYVIFRSFGLADNGGLLKARAIDVYGNATESVPAAVQRFTDFFPPTASFSVSGQLIGGNLVGGHPFSVDVTLGDTGSGVELALLRRDGLIVAAAFGNGVLTYQEAPPLAGAEFDYEVTVIDGAGNQTTASRRYTAVNDSPPIVTSVNSPATILEASTLNVNVAARDDLGVASISVSWNGLSKDVEFAQPAINDSAQFFTARFALGASCRDDG